MTTAIVPFDILPEQNNATGILQLSKIEVNEAYSRKWNVRMRDFVCLTRNGQLHGAKEINMREYARMVQERKVKSNNQHD